MIKNHKLAQNISDVGWGRFQTYLSYKAERKAKHLFVIGRFEPTSKKCHVCGYIKKDLTLSDREWLCPGCQTKHDRDINAAINIKLIGLIDIGMEQPESKPVDHALVDDRCSGNLRSYHGTKQEASAFRRG